MDPNTERFSLVERNIPGTLPASKLIYDNHKIKTKQTIIDIFLKRVSSQEEPQAGPSRGVPEEGIVTIGDDSSVHMLPMKTWDKMQK